MAVIEEGKVVQLKMVQPSKREHVGDIYVGRITDVLPGIQAAFVDIGTEKSGYLHRDQLLSYQNSDIKQKESKSISSFIHQGQEVLVQIVKEGIGSKGPKLTEIIELPGQFLVYLPLEASVAVSRKMRNEEEREKWREFGQEVSHPGEGAIFRTLCEEHSVEMVLAELNRQRKDYKSILEKKKSAKKPSLLFEAETMIDQLLQETRIETSDEVIVDDFDSFQILTEKLTCSVKRYNGKENIFNRYQLEQEIEKTLNKVVTLDNGAYLVIENTEACTVIDVNSGKFQGKSNQQETVLKINMEAAKEIARQIRLRDLAGMILIDFIDMKSSKDQEKVISVFKKNVKADFYPSMVHGFTRLGILEVTRRRTRHSLAETLLSPCLHCDATGLVNSAMSVYYQLERDLMEYERTDTEAVWVDISSDLKALIDDENHKLLQERSKLSIYFTEGKEMNRSYLIRHIGTEEEVKDRLNRYLS